MVIYLNLIKNHLLLPFFLIFYLLMQNGLFPLDEKEPFRSKYSVKKLNISFVLTNAWLSLIT